MADGMIGYGSTVRIGRGDTPVWTELALVGDIDMPEDSVDDVEVTHMKSPGRRKQFIAGLIDTGSVSIPMNYIPNSPSDVLLRELQGTGEQVLVGITLTNSPDAEEEVFSGYLSGYARTAPVSDKMTATVTFRLSESVTGVTA